jgi:hypothetical protein
MRAFVVFCGLLAAGCAQIEQKQAEEAAVLTPEHFRATATLQDDALDVNATISTALGNNTTGGIVRLQWHDESLRAVVAKGTGATRMFIDVTDKYFGGWKFYRSLNFATPSGPVSVPLLAVDRDVSCDRYACLRTERLTAELTEAQLRAVATMPGTSWPMKLLPKDGPDLVTEIPLAELRGLLLRLDEYRAKRR